VPPADTVIHVPTFRGSSRSLERIRNNALCAAIALVALGLVMAYSVSAARTADVRVGYIALLLQCAYITLGAMALFFFAYLDYHLLDRMRWYIFFGAVIALGLVLVPGIGVSINGARRWYRIFGFSMQPSEIGKMALLVIVAAYAARRGRDIQRFLSGFLPVMVLVGTIAGLVLIEPDFGTAALLGGMGTIVLVVAGARVLHVFISALPGIAALVYLICQSRTRLNRIFAFVDPWAHYDGAGFQVIQSLTALGSGGAMGHGPGASLQKLYFLPEPGSDFILAIVGEELGLIGALGVLALFALFVVEGMRISGRARDTFGSLLAFGITCMIGLQAAINIAVVTASVPTKGIALPFISAGGSSLLFSMAGVGVLLNIARQAEQSESRDARKPTVTGELVT